MMTAVELALLEMRAAFHERAGCSMAYTRSQNIVLKDLAGAVGAFGIAPIAECGNGRFEFAEARSAASTQALILEAFGADGETVVDLVGWPLDDPTRLLTAFGRCGLVGLAEAHCGSTYFMGAALDVHLSPRDWLVAGCRGAAIVDPHRAAMQLVEAPGRIAARNQQHGRQLINLLRSAVDPSTKVVVPSSARRLAA